jgi:hypothetical protein
MKMKGKMLRRGEWKILFSEQRVGFKYGNKFFLSTVGNEKWRT